MTMVSSRCCIHHSHNRGYNGPGVGSLRLDVNAPFGVSEMGLVGEIPLHVLNQ